ncbi:MAG: hypothetical protein PHN51_10430 [Candidatus Nanopelagicales bacterium]|nr:hypothetical protein [Candidatus Nanopelagicales bacterium]
MQYLEIFDRSYLQRSPRTGVTQQRDVDYLRRHYIFNRDAIDNYYKTRNFAVKNTNIISRMVEHFPLNLGSDTYQYLESVDRRLVYLAKHFKFTSDIEKGVFHPPHFFGNGGGELILAGYESFDADAFVRNWKNESSVRVLTHPRNDTRILLPLGTNDGNKSGIGSVLINVPKLALQYREFLKEQNRKADTDLILGKNNFVIKYVLPNMMDDVIDHTLLNRVIDRFYGTEYTEPDKKYAFKIFQPDTQLNRYVDEVLEQITQKPMTFIEMLRHIKLVFNEDASELLALPDFFGTRQSKPAIVASRLRYMTFLLDACKSKSENKGFINDWKKFSERLLNDKGLLNLFDTQTETDLLEKLNRINMS